MTGQHYLIVHADPDDGMDIEHPPSCPTGTDYDGRVKTYTCDVGVIEAAGEVGLHFRRDEKFVDWSQMFSEFVPVGRHRIEYWYERDRRTGEFSCGLQLSETDGQL